MKLLSVEGAPRSGTTLVQQIINSHPHAVCTHEFGLDRLLAIIDQMFVAEREQHRQLAALNWRSEVKQRWFAAGSRRTAGQPINDRLLVPRKDRDMMPLLETYFSTISNKPEVQIGGDKLPNVRNQMIWDIRESGIPLKAIFIIRNPISVIESSLERADHSRSSRDTWHIHSIDEAIDEWLKNWEMAAIRAAGGDRDDLFIRYADLCEDFEAETARVARHLGVDQQFSNIIERKRSAHPRRRLSTGEMDLVFARIGPWLHEWRSVPLIDQLRAHGAHWLASCSINDRISIEDDTLLPNMLVRGFCNPEPPIGVWTNGHEAHVRYRLRDAPSNTRLEVQLEFYPFDNGSGAYDYRVQFAGEQQKRLSGKIASAAKPVSRSFDCNLQDGRFDLRFFVPNPKSLDDAPRNDTRRLGLMIKSITHRRVGT